MARTQARLPTLAARQDPATFMAFDVLAVDGGDLCALPWAERRQILQDLYELSGGTSTWRVSTAFADGHGLLAATAGMGLEGVVAKRVTSRYWPGRRTPYWRKVKHRSYEWFDLLGWRAPKGRDPGGCWPGGTAASSPARSRRSPQRRTGASRRTGSRARRRGPRRGAATGGPGARSRWASWNGCPAGGCESRWRVLSGLSTEASEGMAEQVVRYAVTAWVQNGIVDHEGAPCGSAMLRVRLRRPTTASSSSVDGPTEGQRGERSAAYPMPNRRRA